MKPLMFPGSSKRNIQGSFITLSFNLTSILLSDVGICSFLCNWRGFTAVSDSPFD